MSYPSTPPPILPDLLGCIFTVLMFALSLAAFVYTVRFFAWATMRALGATP